MERWLHLCVLSVIYSFHMSTWRMLLCWISHSWKQISRFQDIREHAEQWQMKTNQKIYLRWIILFYSQSQVLEIMEKWKQVQFITLNPRVTRKMQFSSGRSTVVQFSKSAVTLNSHYKCLVLTLITPCPGFPSVNGPTAIAVSHTPQPSIHRACI